MSADGFLNAWFDFGGDGSWGEFGDQVFANEVLRAGTNQLSLAVPLTAPGGDVFSRFRVSSATDLSYHDRAGDGEVEDYLQVVGGWRVLEVRYDGAVTVVFETSTGLDFTLEYRDRLSEGDWIALGQLSGDGEVRFLSDSDPSARSRIYRVRADAP